MHSFREPFLLPFLALAAGVAAERLWGSGLAESAAATISFFLLAWISQKLGRLRWYRVSIVLGSASLGMFLAVARVPAGKPVLDAGPGELVRLEGCVVEPPQRFEDRDQWIVELAPRARLRVVIYRTANAPRHALVPYGTPVELAGRPRPPRNFGNEGAFDLERFWADRQIYWTVNARELIPRPGTCGSVAWAGLYRLRGWLLSRIDSQFGEMAPQVSALLLGETANLDQSWTDAFRETGTYHALVVSGTHVTALAAGLVLLLRGFFLKRLHALFLTAGLTWLYALLAGSTAPVLRAAAGFTLVLTCRFFYRRVRLLNLLALAGIGFLIHDPRQLFHADFQLSFGALAAIAAVAMPLHERWLAPWRNAMWHLTDLRRDPRLPPAIAAIRVELRLIAETIALSLRVPIHWIERASQLIVRGLLIVATIGLTSAAVQLALALLFVVYFHRFAFTAIVANIGVVTLVEPAIGIGFLAVLSGLPPLIWMTRTLLEWAAAVAGWHAAWEPLWRTPDPPLAVALLGVGALGWLAWSLRARSRWMWPGLAAATVCGVLLVVSPFPVDARAGWLELTAIDVGQGDALLVNLPNGERLLVDGGGFPSFSPRKEFFDTGERVVAPYLWSRGIRTLDVVCLTHGHADHMNGLPSILESFHPRELWVSGSSTSRALDALYQRARSLGIRIRVRQEGEAFAYGGARIRVVSPARASIHSGPPRNNDSLGLLLEHGRHRFLLPGDAERSVEESLAYDGNLGRIDVLKVGHHGGRTSTTEALLRMAHPAVAVISAGAGNRYGHPHPEVLARLEEIRASTFRTDRDGRVTVRSDGTRLSYSTYRWSRAAALD